MPSKAEIGWRLFLAGLTAGTGTGCAATMQAEVLKQVSEGGKNAAVSPVETPMGNTFTPEAGDVVVEKTPEPDKEQSAAEPEETPGARVAYRNVQLWSGPGTNYESIREIYKNEKVRVLGLTPDGKYAKVELSDGTVGYLGANNFMLEINQAAMKLDRLTEADLPLTQTPEPSSTPEPTATSEPTAEVTPGAQVVSKGLNVRKGPGLGYAIVGGLKYGDTMELLGKTPDGAWAKVRFPDGSEGWVSANNKYIVVNEAGEDLVLDPSELPPTPTASPTAAPRPTAVPPRPVQQPPAPRPEAPRQEAARGIRPDVMEQIVAMYGSVDNMVGKEFVMNGALGVQDGSNPTFHSRVKFLKLIEDLGWRQAPDGSKKNHTFRADAGGRIVEVHLMDNPKSNSRPLIDPALMGVWGYNWSLFPEGGSGEPVKHIYNVALRNNNASLAVKGTVGILVGCFIEDYAEDWSRGHCTAYRGVFLD